MSSSSADVVVIGAGAVGVAIAKRLAERNLSVIIVETASEIGSNTSRRYSFLYGIANKQWKFEKQM